MSSKSPEAIQTSTAATPPGDQPDRDTAERQTSLANESQAANEVAVPAVEIGGQKGPEPTRYGDWEKNGRCTDF